MKAQQQLKNRQKVWTNLHNRGLARLWAPFMVDCALELSANNADLDQILNSTEFYDLCRNHPRQKDRFATFQWNRLHVERGLWNGDPLLRHFLRQYSLKIRASGFYQDAGDFEGQLLYETLKAIPRFQPGKIKDGRFVSWGFEAYLIQFALPRCWNEFHSEHSKDHTLSLSRSYCDSDSPLEDSIPSFEPLITNQAGAFGLWSLEPGEIQTALEKAFVNPELPPQTQSVFLLRAACWPTRRISRTLSISEAMVRWHFRRACKYLLHSLKAHVVKRLAVSAHQLEEELLDRIPNRCPE